MRISSNDKLLLIEVLNKHRPDLLTFVLDKTVVLDELQRDAVSELLVAEMLTSELEGPMRETSLSRRGEALDDLAGRIRMIGILGSTGPDHAC